MLETPTQEPGGLRYVTDFISKGIEGQLIERIKELPLQPFQFGQFEGKRRIASFGFRFNYSTRRLEPSEPVPRWLDDVVAAVEKLGGPLTKIGQILCTEYGVGVGIGWHRDKPQFDRIFGLSLGSLCKFRFRRKAGDRWERFTLDTDPRSLYEMADEARHSWEHSIPAVEAPRYSITLRTMACSRETRL